jgi:hypothetical protein
LNRLLKNGALVGFTYIRGLSSPVLPQAD